MPGLRPIHWRKFEKFLFFVGCQFSREKGDHRVYTRPGLLRPIVVPRDTQLPVFIIRNNLRVLGIKVGDYLEILERIS
ncbi:MAG: type II toxin-antitoxin system HicA family toxin [Candidatus Kerfeldbacteria bacterium]|nr:type II toxin-antitoxin system HicA family toxin [Candidatus Kerfeldbacteria bacterium]